MQEANQAPSADQPAGYRFRGPEVRDEDGRLVCPKCACPDLRVVNTWHAAGAVKRRRRCRHCRFEFTTEERTL